MFDLTVGHRYKLYGTPSNAERVFQVDGFGRAYSRRQQIVSCHYVDNGAKCKFRVVYLLGMGESGKCVEVS